MDPRSDADSFETRSAKHTTWVVSGLIAAVGETPASDMRIIRSV
jgi:hypothetical protein